MPLCRNTKQKQMSVFEFLSDFIPFTCCSKPSGINRQQQKREVESIGDAAKHVPPEGGARRVENRGAAQTLGITRAAEKHGRLQHEQRRLISWGQQFVRVDGKGAFFPPPRSRDICRHEKNQHTRRTWRANKEIAPSLQLTHICTVPRHSAWPKACTQHARSMHLCDHRLGCAFKRMKLGFN